jgi:hypothetical protein
MRFGNWALLTFVLCAASQATAGSIESSLAKLGPEERSHQACILKGLHDAPRDPRLRLADRMKTSIFSPAVLAGTVLSAPGGAVRVNGHWFRLAFSCTLTHDYMKATSVKFELGKEIPKEAWNELGLWG